MKPRGGNNGQITGITDSTDTAKAGRSVSYAYDVWARLKTAQTTGSTQFPQWGLRWDYDRFGNRLAQVVTAGTGVPSNAVTINPPTNRITDTGYGYDAAGNMTADGLNTLTYDGENRVATSAQGGTTTTYTYDGAGLRVKKQVGAGTATVYIFSGSKVIAEYAAGGAAGSPLREHIYSGSQLLATIEGSTTKYHHADHLSARFTTDASGGNISEQGHYPFGENWYATGTASKWKFTSYERDGGTGESGNDYAMARYHISRLGRFNRPDPLAGSAGDPQSLNRYAYVLGDPINSADPLGLKSSGQIEPSYAPEWGNCTVDGAATPCGLAFRMASSGAAVRCPKDACQIIGPDGRPQQYWAFVIGGGYYPFSGPGALYFSRNAAALAFASLYQGQSQREKAEYRVNFYVDANGVYSFTAPTVDPCQPVEAGASVLACGTLPIYPTDVPRGTTPVGTGHTHPLEDGINQSEIIFGGDIVMANAIYRDNATIDALYTSSVSGRVLVYYPTLYVPGKRDQCQATFILKGGPTPSPCKPY